MTAIARKIAATPVRPAPDAWQRIIDLVAPRDATARAELLDIAGVAASLITEEAPKSSAIIVHGSGSRVRIYCLYGVDAIEGEKTNETAIPNSPIENGSDWKMSLPCPVDDLEWVRASLKKRSSHVTARDLGETGLPGDDEEDPSASRAATINVESFLRP